MGLDRLVEVWEGRLGLMTSLVGYERALEVGYWLVVCVRWMYLTGWSRWRVMMVDWRKLNFRSSCYLPGTRLISIQEYYMHRYSTLYNQS